MLALGGADPTKVPSAGARGSERTIWFLDADAAAQL
jgi:6-phosphogluconolactonase